MTVARRGEVWLVDLGMAAKVRPAVVVACQLLTLIGLSSQSFRTRQARANRDSKRQSQYPS